MVAAGCWAADRTATPEASHTPAPAIPARAIKKRFTVILPSFGNARQAIRFAREYTSGPRPSARPAKRDTLLRSNQGIQTAPESGRKRGREKSLALEKAAWARNEFLPIRQDHFHKTHCGRAVLVRVADDRHLIARLERVLTPAMIREAVWARAFRHPFHGIAVFVGHGKGDLRVGVDPLELGNSGLERCVMAAVIH